MVSSPNETEAKNKSQEKKSLKLFWVKVAVTHLTVLQLHEIVIGIKCVFSSAFIHKHNNEKKKKRMAEQGEGV